MRFIVETTFTQAPTAEILALIPAEMARGHELDAAGVREALYVAADQSRAWQILKAESPDHVKNILASFPLAPFVASTITSVADPA